MKFTLEEEDGEEGKEVHQIHKKKLGEFEN